MKIYDVVIIGAGPAGIVTAMTVKKQNPEKEVVLIGKEEKGLVPCGIPYIFGELNSVEKNEMGPKHFIDAHGIVKTDPVIDVNINEKWVKLQSGEEFKYDKLVFATGSIPVEPKKLKGFNLENVFYIKKSHKYISYLFHELRNKKDIIIVGGGFIGAEVAEQLALYTDKSISLVEAEEYCFNKAFSRELGQIATEQLKKSNVNVYTSKLVDEIIGNNGMVSKVKLKSGEELKADAVILSIGYRPNVELAQRAGLPLNKMNAIKVDAYERTPIKDVFAVGDCSQTTGFLTGRSDNIMLASTAGAEARVLGYNLFGIKIKKRFIGTLGIFSTKINGLAMAAAGINEHTGAEANIDFLSVKFTDTDRHPGALNDAMPLTAKLFFSPSDGTILGGEIWGGCAVGEMINNIGLAIQKGVTIYELVSYQIGTHPLLTTAPTKPVIIKAAEMAINQLSRQ